jgi:uncharacterized protein YggE
MTLFTGRNRIYLLLATLAVAALLAVGWAALAGAQEDNPDAENTETTGMQMLEESASDGDAGVPYDGPSGIWVSGTGKASAAPDIAVVSMGVESLEDTAAAARDSAATAMRSAMSALTNAGVSLDDIQTRHFNISPRYQQVEIERCDGEEDPDTEGGQEESMNMSCYKSWESRLIGYSVSNQAQVVKIRSLARVGTIIDAVTEAAGDLVRVNGIRFDIEDPQPLQDEARANAVADLKRKAGMLADLSGVKLGRLVYLNEESAYTSPQPLYARAEATFDNAASTTTTIAGGELEYTNTIQGVFLIAGDADPEHDEAETQMETTEGRPEGTEEPQG